MRTVKGAMAVACFGLIACGDQGPTAASVHTPGSVWDPDGDGPKYGVYVDTDNDGKSDGIDTDGDGLPDLNLKGGPLDSGDGDDGDDGDDTGDDDDDSTTDDGDGDGTGNCQEQVIRNDRLPPDMLIVLDRSGSMANNDRWDPSVAALKNVTMELGGTIDFGLMSFPQNDSCAPGKVDVPIAPNNAGPINTALSAMESEGGTPTSASLAEAHKLLGAVNADPDAQQKGKYVLLVTDGEPNCLDVDCGPVPFDFWAPDFEMRLDAWSKCASAGDPAAIKASIEEIQKMSKDGIKTYVVGYATGSGGIKSTMDMMAQAGGTGAKSHIVVNSGDELTKALQDIAGQAASCTLTLEKAVDNPSYVLVTIDKDTSPVRLILNQPDGNGFAVGDDKRTVTIQGTSCDLLRSGNDHKLYVEVLCAPPIL
jgi:Mg-chelatase subunit ChlD